MENSLSENTSQLTDFSFKISNLVIGLIRLCHDYSGQLAKDVGIGGQLSRVQSPILDPLLAGLLDFSAVAFFTGNILAPEYDDYAETDQQHQAEDATFEECCGDPFGHQMPLR